MKNILKNYRRRLLNLGPGNRALVQLRLSAEMHVDVQEFDFLINSPAFSVIQHLLAGKKRIIISPFADSRFAPVEPVSRRLRNIKRKEEMIFEERGSRELYIGWPFVHGKFSDGTAVRCPLLFFPVALQLNAAREWELVQDSSQPPHLNQSFLLAYAHYNNVPVAEALLELDLRTLPHHPLEFRTKLYELLKENQLAVHVGRDFFTDRLKHFREYKKADYEENLRPGQLHLEQEAVLGIYPQAASYLLADYDELLLRDGLHQMEDLFPAVPSESINSTTQAQNTFTAFDIDASQEAALQQVKQGRSLVVQGPPGTGKSQLICNLVSDFTARGKKVLVVSQKRAALDVVHQRLSAKGFGNFAALVHDIHADRKSIYAQLQLQIDQVEEYRKQNLALNSIYTDRTFLEVCRSINRCTQKLEAFKHALFDTSRCGWSAKELYLQSSLSQSYLPLGNNFRQFTAETITDFMPRLRQYLQRADVLEAPDFALKERRSMQGWGWPQRQELEQTIKELNRKYNQVAQSITELSGFSFKPEDLPQSIASLPTITDLQKLLAQPEVLQNVLVLSQKTTDAKALEQQIIQLRKVYTATTLPDAVLPAGKTGQVQQAIKVYEQQRGQWLKSINWHLIAPEKKALKNALALYGWELTEEAVTKLQARLQLREQAESLLQSLNQSINSTLTVTDSPETILQQLNYVEQAIQGQKLLQQLQKAKVFSQKLILQPGLTARLQQLGQSITQLQKDYSQWLQWLPDIQIRQLLNQPEHTSKLLQALQQNFEPLVAHDTLLATFTKAEQEMAQLLLAQSINPEKVDLEALFLNSVQLAWLYELEQQHPELRMPSSGDMESLEQELQRLLEEKNRLSQEIVLSKLREQTYTNIEYNRLGNAVTYRRLHAQVIKKRSLYPIRKLFTLFSEEILDLVPCWLASPDTVSAVLPLAQCFDLVIFDEASQCYAESGIPAILRGKQIVVAGDEQQLKPSDLYRARWNPEGEEAEELTAESLLQLCGLYLPQTMLSQHYRSRYPELIGFSNQHFYRNKLELIPDRREINAGHPAIRFVKVQGLWQQNTNKPEAEVVVKLVLDMLQQGQPDIGVITFNYNQQMLVMDLLEDAAQSQSINLPPSLLVKNIENMQGDEKEVIILSVGYAPDEKGKLAMQFGSLNQAGGENRLNVAVTRAKKKIIVVSSIEAAQLQVENTLHQGPKLLKAYLQYAQAVSNGGFIYNPVASTAPAPDWLLKERLQTNFSGLQQELPFADLAWKQQQQYSGVILTDDDLYFSQPSVRHSHADVPQLLQKRHWPYLKVYSRQYWEDREGVFQKLKTMEAALNS
ncbi:AAA domain-containing protein [Pontibacter vulgaris]|uniref:AAA domain-containing protein n=1 Tax=Pontibacter vulgaris TaxID=2905679 RepID=UPI001FA6E6FE|nr:AAA domain-containing protein [Pontibacter vulgaris]